MEKAKYGKMRQVNAVNGSQMVVKIGVRYYRRVKGKKGVNWKMSIKNYCPMFGKICLKAH